MSEGEVPLSPPHIHGAGKFLQDTGHGVAIGINLPLSALELQSQTFWPQVTFLSFSLGFQLPKYQKYKFSSFCSPALGAHHLNLLQQLGVRELQEQSGLEGRMQPQQGRTRLR